MSDDVFMRGVSYQLGEIASDYGDASGFREVMAAARLPDMPDVWGWGRFHTTADAYGLGLAAARRALAASELRPEDIDLTLFCCSYFPDIDDPLYLGTGKILQTLRLQRSLVDGLTLSGCATLLSGIERATQLVRSQLHNHVLVIGIDKMPAHIGRFFDYALFSDAAAACVVSRKSGAAPRIVGSARGIHLDEVIGGVRFNPKNLLHIRVLDDLLTRTGVAKKAIRMAFNNNVFLPVKTLKDTVAGFTRDQMFLDNVTRTGHCLSCDSLINLADFATRVPPEPSSQFLLQADGNGCCSMVLVKW